MACPAPPASANFNAMDATPPDNSSQHRRRRLAIFIGGWAIALGIAFLLDPPVAQWMYDWRPGIPRHFIEYQSGPLSREDALAKILRAPGDFRFTLAIALLLLILHRDHWKSAGLLVLAGIASGSNSVFKWIFGRTRPLRDGPSWDLFNGGLIGAFEHMDVSFPSGHAALAFASAAALAVAMPRWRAWFYAGATLVGLERIAENAHYLSDVTAAALLGVLCVKGVVWVAGVFITEQPDTLDRNPTP